MVLVLELVHRQRFNEALLFSRIADALSTGIACLHVPRLYDEYRALETPAAPLCQRRRLCEAFNIKP